MVDTYTLGNRVRALLVQYSWMNVALIYTIDVEQRKCDFLQQDFESALDSTPGSPTIVFKHLVQDSEETTIKQTLEMVRTRARSRL